MEIAQKLKRVRTVREHLTNALTHCAICPRRCGANRLKGERGFCRAGAAPAVYSYSAHHGEEPPISGVRGSGTIFFSYCNMKCVYCQNYRFSQLDKGEEMPVERLAAIMVSLQKLGCHNVNLVSPTHYLPQILDALEIALASGLSLPIVYNTGGYELAEIIGLLAGIVDIYLPDMRYADDAEAARYSAAPGYVAYNRAAVLEMHRQVGMLTMNARGIAERGLIIRLLALPHGRSGTEATLRFISERISPDTYLSIMSQYHPIYRAGDYPELTRPVTAVEYKNVVDEAHRLGLNNGWIQEAPDSRFLGTNIREHFEPGL